MRTVNHGLNRRKKKTSGFAKRAPAGGQGATARLAKLVASPSGGDADPASFYADFWPALIQGAAYSLGGPTAIPLPLLITYRNAGLPPGPPIGNFPDASASKPPPWPPTPPPPPTPPNKAPLLTYAGFGCLPGMLRVRLPQVPKSRAQTPEGPGREAPPNIPRGTRPWGFWILEVGGLAPPCPLSRGKRLHWVWAAGCRARPGGKDRWYAWWSPRRPVGVGVGRG